MPFALLGLASLALLEAIARRLYGPAAACVAVALDAVNAYLLWIFRVGLQDGMVISLLARRYDPRINNVARLWMYDRRYFYDGWHPLCRRLGQHLLVGEGIVRRETKEEKETRDGERSEKTKRVTPALGETHRFGGPSAGRP